MWPEGAKATTATTLTHVTAGSAIKASMIELVHNLVQKVNLNRNIYKYIIYLCIIKIHIMKKKTEKTAIY